MTRLHLLSLAAVALTACGGAVEPPKEPDPKAAAAAAEEKKPEPAAAAAEEKKPAVEEPKADPAKLAKITKTPEEELKKGLTKKAVEDAIKAVKIGEPWEKTTKALTAKIGKPTYAMTPGRNMVQEDWIWIVAEDDKCYFNGLGRRGDKVDQKPMAGTYYKVGSKAHIAEEIRAEGAGFLHVCEGKVTAGPKE